MDPLVTLHTPQQQHGCRGVSQPTDSAKVRVRHQCMGDTRRDTHSSGLQTLMPRVNGVHKSVHQLQPVIVTGLMYIIHELQSQDLNLSLLSVPLLLILFQLIVRGLWN